MRIAVACDARVSHLQVHLIKRTGVLFGIEVTLFEVAVIRFAMIRFAARARSGACSQVYVHAPSVRE